MGKDDDNSGGGSGDNIYKGNGEKLVLVSLSDSYLELKAISVNASRLSSYPTLHYLLTT